ncbi:MAG: S41 family peptidase [Planctomycetota bacterium]
MTKSTLLPLVLLALALPTPALSAQDGELDVLVAGEASKAAGLPVDDLWSRALALREAEALGSEGELDRALERLLEGEGLPAETILLAAAARMQGDKPEPAALVDPLQPLLLHSNEEYAVGAAGLLGNHLFRKLTRSARDELGKELVRAARDLDRSPEARMAFARSAAGVGRGTEMRQARDEMRAFLASADPALRSLGALSLAGTGIEIEGDLEDELERLAALPDERGSLAGSYLKQEQIRDLHERKYKDLRSQLQERRLPDSLERFEAVMQMITNYHLEGARVSEDDLVHAALDGMLRYLDEHSSYFGPDAYAKFLLDLEAEYGGIGAYVGIDPADRLFTINRPIYSGPAYRAGLQTDDKIVRIDDWPTVGEPVDDVIKRLKGEPGTQVKLYVWRRGMDPDLIDRPDDDMVVVLDREEIQIPAVAHQMLPGGIGMVELTTFSRGVDEELAEVFGQLREQGMRALVLDLRRNSGGLLTEARNVADLFLPRDKKVVTTQGTIGRPETLRTLSDAAVPDDMPIFVLTSRFTASASEIVAGALKDHERATVMGEVSFGKGSVQQLLPVLGIDEDEYVDQNRNGRWDTWEEIVTDHDGDGVVDYRPRVKMTIAKYLLPSGRSIHRERDEEGNLLSEGGIEPDIEVRFPLVESWRINERQDVRDSGKVKDYVSKQWDENFDLFRRLAITDLKDEDSYPNFDRLMVDLETTLPREDVRALVRSEVRRRIQDDRGAEFPIGDFQEDFQVQRAVHEALKHFDETPGAYDAFAKTFLDPDAVEEDRVAAVTAPTRTRMRDAATLIRELRDGDGEVTPEALDELLDLLDTKD